PNVAWATLGLAIFNQEFIIPRIADRLQYGKEDVAGDKELLVTGAYEPNDIHIEGEKASRKERVVRKFRCMIPEKLAGIQIHLEAQEAHYINDGKQKGWELIGTRPAEPPADFESKVLEVRDSGRYFLHTREVDFDTVTRPARWFQYASTARLF